MAPSRPAPRGPALGGRVLGLTPQRDPPERWGGEGLDLLRASGWLVLQ